MNTQIKLAEEPKITVEKGQTVSQEVKDTMTQEINNMLSFAVMNGTIINTEVIELLKKYSIDDLINAHNLLCKNVAPATPKSINYTARLNDKNKNKSILNRLPLVRNMVFLAIFFLIVFIVTSMSTGVNNESLDNNSPLRFQAALAP